MVREFTADESAFIREKHEQRWSHTRIARQLQVRSSRIVDELRRQGVHVRPLRYRLTAEQEQEVVRRYVAGELPAVLGRAFGVHAVTVRNIVRRAGEPVNSVGGGLCRRVFTPEEIARIRDMASARSPQEEIAYALGTTQHRISQLMRDHGIAPAHAWAAKGERHAGWKGGRRIDPNGYPIVSIPPDDPYASMRMQNGYVREHRLVMARWLGRPLLKNEQVHHRDGDKLNNAIENLQLLRNNHGNGSAWRCRSCGSYDIEAIPLATDQPLH